MYTPEDSRDTACFTTAGETLPVRILLVLAAIQNYIITQKCEVKNRQIEK